MPVLDGYLTTKEIRENFDGIIIIGCSAYDD